MKIAANKITGCKLLDAINGEVVKIDDQLYLVAPLATKDNMLFRNIARLTDGLQLRISACTMVTVVSGVFVAD